MLARVNMIDASEYKDLFLTEARAHVQAINQALSTLERTPSDASAAETIFRSAHTLKGMAGTMSYDHLAQLAHGLEDLLDRVRRHELAPAPDLLELLRKSADVLSAMLNNIAEDRPGEGAWRVWLKRLRTFTPVPHAPEGDRSTS